MSDMFSNASLIGSALVEFNQYVAGDVFITLFLITVLIVLFGAMFRFPIEWLAILLVPLAIYFVSFNTAYYAVAGIIFLVVAFIIIRNFWITLK